MFSDLLQLLRRTTRLGGIAACLLAGCGGAPSGNPDGGTAAAAGGGHASQPAWGGGSVGPLSGPGAPEARYDLVIFNDRAVLQDLDQLDPRQGKGYQSLNAFIYLKGKPRSKSPVHSVKPFCQTPTQCEYIPPREAGFAERYTISIDDASVAQLGADKDVVVISARQLKLARPATVNVTLTIAGQATVVKRIVYGAALS